MNEEDEEDPSKGFGISPLEITLAQIVISLGGWLYVSEGEARRVDQYLKRPAFSRENALGLLIASTLETPGLTRYQRRTLNESMSIRALTAIYLRDPPRHFAEVLESELLKPTQFKRFSSYGYSSHSTIEYGAWLNGQKGPSSKFERQVEIREAKTPGDLMRCIESRGYDEPCFNADFFRSGFRAARKLISNYPDAAGIARELGARYMHNLPAYLTALRVADNEPCVDFPSDLAYFLHTQEDLPAAIAVLEIAVALGARCSLSGGYVRRLDTFKKRLQKRNK